MPTKQQIIDRVAASKKLPLKAFKILFAYACERFPEPGEDYSGYTKDDKLHTIAGVVDVCDILATDPDVDWTEWLVTQKNQDKLEDIKRAEELKVEAAEIMRSAKSKAKRKGSGADANASKKKAKSAKETKESKAASAAGLVFRLSISASYSIRSFPSHSLTTTRTRDPL